MGDASLRRSFLFINDQQFERIISAIKSDIIFSPQIIIATLAFLCSLTAVVFAITTYRRQRLNDRRKLVLELHDQWWSAELDDKRHVVWEELEKWQKEGSNSPAMKHYSQGKYWQMRSEQLRSHARVMYFFCDINTFLKNKLIDEDMTYSLFGEHHYEWYRDYFNAIIIAIENKPRSEGALMPRFVKELREFESKFDAWKLKRAQK